MSDLQAFESLDDTSGTVASRQEGSVSGSGNLGNVSRGTPLWLPSTPRISAETQPAWDLRKSSSQCGSRGSSVSPIWSAPSSRQASTQRGWDVSSCSSPGYGSDKEVVSPYGAWTPESAGSKTKQDPRDSNSKDSDGLCRMASPSYSHGTDPGSLCGMSYSSVSRGSLQLSSMYDRDPYRNSQVFHIIRSRVPLDSCSLCSLRLVCKNFCLSVSLTVKALKATPLSPYMLRLPAMAHSFKNLLSLDLSSITDRDCKSMPWALATNLQTLRLGPQDIRFFHLCKLSKLTSLEMMLWDDEGLPLADHLPALQAVQVTGKVIDATGLAGVSSLKSLTIPNAIDLAAYFQHLTKLEDLTVLQAAGFSSESVSFWSRYLEPLSLTSLRFHVFDKVPRSQDAFQQCLTRLITLALSARDNSIPVFMLSGLHQLMSLEVLLLDPKPGALWTSIASLARLTKLATNAPVTDSKLLSLTCTDLQSLDIMYDPCPVYCQLFSLARFPEVTNLRVAFVSVLEVGVSCALHGLLHLSRLCGLTLEGAETRTGKAGLWQPQHFLETLGECTALTSLGIISMGMTDKALKPLSSLTALKALHLDGNAGLSSRFLQYLKPLTRLTSVSLAGTGALESQTDIEGIGEFRLRQWEPGLPIIDVCG